jgi:DNA-directed RNA polymerase II subunit RPB4
MSTKLRHRPLIEEEDASALKLGPEFNNAGCLLISEVKYLLENRDKDAPDTAWVSHFTFISEEGKAKYRCV